MALKGSLWAPLSGGSMTLVGEVDSEISRNGVFIDGTLPHDISVAQLTLSQPVVNVEMVLLPQPRASFVLTGDVTLPWFTKRIDVVLDRQVDVSPAIDAVTTIVDAWRRFHAAYQQDPVAAVGSSFTVLLDVAAVPEPPWVDPLFSTIGTMQDLFPGSDPRTLIEYALAGKEVRIPAGSGFPQGGRDPRGCPIGYTLYQDRCWTNTPFAGEELGYSYVCPTGFEEAGKCWIVPPSATSTKSKISYCCERNFRLECTKTCYKCPLGTYESGGKCYVSPPGPAVLSSPNTPQRFCAGVDSGGVCWKLGRAPRTGSPEGGANQACPLVAPIYSDGRCWAIPPTEQIQVDRVPGICSTEGISCQVDGLLTETISPLIRNAVEGLIGSAQSDEDNSAAEPSSTAVNLDFGDGWSHYGGEYAPAAVRKQGGICLVEGLARTSHAATTDQKHVATLSPECRPEKRLVFNLNNREKTARVDVFADGKILWVAGGGDHRWVSLSGIRFSPAAAAPLALSPGWQDYGGSYGEARFQREGNMCFVQGLVKGSDIASQPHIATLPAECRPTERLILNQSNHDKTARIDVRPDGRIIWVAGGTDYGWISLSGIAFGTASEPIVNFGSGWSNYGGGYQAASLSRLGGLCFVTGLARTSYTSVADQKHITTLPIGCRPAGRLVFNLNNHDNTRPCRRSPGRPRDLGSRRRRLWVDEPKRHRLRGQLRIGPDGYLLDSGIGK